MGVAQDDFALYLAAVVAEVHLADLGKAASLSISFSPMSDEPDCGCTRESGGAYLQVHRCIHYLLLNDHHELKEEEVPCIHCFDSDLQMESGVCEQVGLAEKLSAKAEVCDLSARMNWMSQVACQLTAGGSECVAFDCDSLDAEFLRVARFWRMGWRPALAHCNLRQRGSAMLKPGLHTCDIWQQSYRL